MKGSKLYSVVHLKCPKCQEGDIFKFKNAYNLKHTGETHSHCPKCGFKYSPEPGFYFGASYVSYAMGVALAITITAIMLPFVDWHHIEIYLGVIFVSFVLFAPLLFRLSRVIWLNFFYKYDKDAIKKHLEAQG